MYDAIEIGQIPAGPPAVAGYVDGRWPTAAALEARFPHAHLLTIATNPEHDADCLDIETGDAVPADAPGWLRRQQARGIQRPCLYASVSLMQSAVRPELTEAGIARAAVRIWTAHYSGLHICGASSCGELGFDADGTQWSDQAFGRDLDQSALVASFFAATAVTVTKPVPKPAAAKEHDMIIITTTAPAGHSWEGTESFLYQPGQALVHIEDEADRTALAAALGVSPAAGAVISWQQFTGLGGT